MQAKCGTLHNLNNVHPVELQKDTKLRNNQIQSAIIYL